MDLEDLFVFTLTVVFWAVYLAVVGLLVALIIYLIFRAVLFLF